MRRLSIEVQNDSSSNIEDIQLCYELLQKLQQPSLPTYATTTTR